jgi:hypothetical protein
MKENKHVSIEGFKKMKDEEVLKTFKKSKYINDEIIIEGKKMSKRKVFSSPPLRAKIENLDRYFSKLSNLQVEKESEIALKKSKMIRESVTVNQDYEIYSEELEKKIAEFKKLNNILEENNKGEDVVKVENIKEAGDIKSLLNDLKGKLMGMLSEFDQKIDSIGKEGNRSMSKLESEYIPYSFKEPMKLMSDIQFKSEFDTLFPGYWNKFINGEILLTKKSKRLKLQFAELRIDQMPHELRRKYRKLLLIVKFIFANIDECFHVSQEEHIFCSIVDDMFDIDFKPDVSRVEIVNDLEADETTGEIKLDLSFLIKH